MVGHRQTEPSLRRDIYSAGKTKQLALGRLALCGNGRLGIGLADDEGCCPIVKSAHLAI